MKICFPVQKDSGLNSMVFNHFGSAPMFIVVDTQDNAISVVVNRDQHHAHGACSPIKAIGGNEVDAVVVGGIGSGALNRLNHIGIKVFRSGADTIQENIAMLLAGTLREYSVESCCGGHAHGTACSH